MAAPLPRGACLTTHPGARRVGLCSLRGGRWRADGRVREEGSQPRGRVGRLWVPGRADPPTARGGPVRRAAGKGKPLEIHAAALSFCPAKQPPSRPAFLEERGDPARPMRPALPDVPSHGRQGWGWGLARRRFLSSLFNCEREVCLTLSWRAGRLGGIPILWGWAQQPASRGMPPEDVYSALTR